MALKSKVMETNIIIIIIKSKENIWLLGDRNLLKRTFGWKLLQEVLDIYLFIYSVGQWHIYLSIVLVSDFFPKRAFVGRLEIYSNPSQWRTAKTSFLRHTFHTLNSLNCLSLSWSFSLFIREKHIYNKISQSHFNFFNWVLFNLHFIKPPWHFSSKLIFFNIIFCNVDWPDKNPHLTIAVNYNSGGSTTCNHSTFLDPTKL